MVADQLLRRRLERRMIAGLHTAMEAMLGWLFPDTSRFGRTSEAGCTALAGLAAANGMLLLKQRARTQQAKQVGRLRTPAQRAIFWPTSFPLGAVDEKRRAVNELVHLQLIAIEGRHLCLDQYATSWPGGAALYQWFGLARYVGVARFLRDSRPSIPGPAQTWWEHWLHWARPTSRALI